MKQHMQKEVEDEEKVRMENNNEGKLNEEKHQQQDDRVAACSRETLHISKKSYSDKEDSYELDEKINRGDSKRVNRMSMIRKSTKSTNLLSSMTHTHMESGCHQAKEQNFQTLPKWTYIHPLAVTLQGSDFQKKFLN